MERAELALLFRADAKRKEGLPGGKAAKLDLTPVVVEETEPTRFMEALVAALGGAGPIFLADPAWGSTERGELDRLVRSAFRNPQSAIATGYLCIPTGGSGGGTRFARHDGATLAAAVRGYGAHFDVARVNAVGVLPLHHVSGLMAWMRCVLTGGRYLPWTWERLVAGEFPGLPADRWFLSLVPTQLQRLLAAPGAIAWLRGFETIHVGGGPLWPALADEAARAGLRLSPGYGMTETAAMVTALRPDEFLAGARDAGRVLPHARIEVDGEGSIRVAGESLFRGYWPDERSAGWFATADLGSIDRAGHVHLQGRRDAAIITGGEKVQPEEVEAALRAGGLFDDVVVLGVPDPTWGQAVVACHPFTRPAPAPELLARALDGLAAFKHPKRFIPVSDWPRNAQGKVNRAALLARIGGEEGRRT